MRVGSIVGCLAMATLAGCFNPQYDLSLSTSDLLFTQDWGSANVSASDSQDVTITFHGDGLVVGYPPGVEPAGWLQVSLPSVADPEGTRLQVRANGVGLPPGSYATSLRVATGNSDGSAVVYQDLAITLTVRDVITIRVDDATIGGSVGSVIFSNASYIVVTKYGAWTVRTDEPALQLSVTSGQGQQQVVATLGANALPPGHHTATVTVESADNQSGSVGIDLAIDSQRWWPDRQTIALTQTVGLARLSDSVQLQSNGDVQALGLAVRSKAAWLTASIAGTTLTVTGDPSALPDGVQLGEVSLTSADPTVPPQTLRVSLYKLSASVVEQSTLEVLKDQGTTPFGIVVDPLRPVVYVGADAGGPIEGYNVYTGEQVLATKAPMDHMVPWRVTSDGHALVARSYAVDTATWGNALIAYDLDANTWGLPSTAAFDESVQDWNLAGVDLYYNHGFFDPDGNSYRNLSDTDAHLAPFSQVFGDRQGVHLMVLQPLGVTLDGGRDMMFDSYPLAVFQLARKIEYRGDQFMSYQTVVPFNGLANIPRPPARAALRSRDAYPLTSDAEIWVDGGIYAGRISADSTGQFFPVMFLNSPNLAIPSVQGLSVSRSGEAVAIWPSIRDGVLARYALNGALVSGEHLSASAPGLAGGPSLFAMIKHSADDLRVITVRDSALATPSVNTIGLMNH